MQGVFQGSVRHTLDTEQAFVDWLMETDMVAARRLVHENSPEQQQILLQQQQQNAQRSKMIADVAERWLMNAPTDAIENKVLIAEINKMAPHKGLQQVGNFNAAAQALAQQNQMLAQQAQGAA
jgi:indole-3-glycerol phosphate synthase